MKTHPKNSSRRTPLAILALSLLLGVAAQAQITGVNSAFSSASIQFIDTSSLDPSSNPGTLNSTLSNFSWPANTTHSFPFVTAPVTSDTAQGDMITTFLGNSYSLNFSNVLLNQAVLNTGFAQLIFTFSVEYQIGGGGLPSQATLFPSFNVNGTVQPGGFAFVGGFINYGAVNTAGTISTVETVNYSAIFNTAGPFVGTAPGIPFNGTTPALVAGTTLTLSGQISFLVDPASINANSQTVPEPSSAVLALLSLPLLLARRRVKATA